jgi:hypothetical protein
MLNWLKFDKKNPVQLAKVVPDSTGKGEFTIGSARNTADF